MVGGTIFVSVRWFSTFFTKICYLHCLSSILPSIAAGLHKLFLMIGILLCIICFLLECLSSLELCLNKMSTTFLSMTVKIYNTKMWLLLKLLSSKKHTCQTNTKLINIFIDFSLKFISLAKRIVYLMRETTLLGWPKPWSNQP